MSHLSFSFSIDEPSHKGITFHLIPEKSSCSVFCIPLQSTSVAFHRILYQLNRSALISVITAEYNSLFVTFYNLSRDKAKQLCESAIKKLHSEITFSNHESDFIYDQYMAKTAYEALIGRALEELEWWLINDSGLIILYSQRGIMISDFKVSSNPTLQSVSQVFLKSHDSDNNITINISGKTTYKKFPIFSITNKVLQKEFNFKGWVDLDYIPCRVLPKFRKAFVVRIINVKNDNARSFDKQASSSNSTINESESILFSSNEVQEIKDYWMYTHGILLQHISAIVKVSFTKDGNSLTYPIECVFDIDQNTLPSLELKKPKIDFEESFRKYISSTINVAALNQKIQIK